MSPLDVASHAESSCHATCLVYGESGVLLRGTAGSGKSSLALQLLDHADAMGKHARLVGDDRIALSLHYDRIVARAHPATLGLIEVRGLGIRRLTQVAHAAVIRLVVDLVETCPRMPDQNREHATILGVGLPCLRLEPSQPRAYVIRQAIAAMRQEANVSSRTQSTALLVTEHCDV